MSLPSIMTATLPPHSPHYGHPSAYATNSASYAANNSLPNGASSLLVPSYSFPNNTPTSVSRVANNTMSRQPPQPSTMTASQSTSALQGSRKRERRPDWHEFYKNGPPKEIIVIDDDSPRPPSRKENERVPQQQQPQATVRGMEQHTNKKRKTGQTTAYDAARDQQAFSHARTYSHADSGSNTISTDRTTSLQTTAPTSLGSHSSHGTSGAYAEDSVAGQKRKRVTRQQIADEKKRKEIEVAGDAYSAYVPPPKPPIKARDVHVPSIKDVSLFLFETSRQVLTDTGADCRQS